MFNSPNLPLETQIVEVKIFRMTLNATVLLFAFQMIVIQHFHRKLFHDFHFLYYNVQMEVS